MNGGDLSVSICPIVVRPYVPADCEATIDIFLRAIREVASKDYSQAEVDAWAQVDDREEWAQRRSSRPTWIAERNGVAVGFSDLEPDGHLDMMFVHPDYQGIGAASLLLATVEAAATARGLSRVFTEASLTARPFFERRGFAVLVRQTVEKRGRTLTNFRMEKIIP
ncbi:acetyltransferase [Rhizobium sp. Root1203]|uniref:GNAT family N-acetyltransferase n=1 Tax=Rhizobium sp. Root1203 TaxID=1736427 RepID=UPI00070A2446|nr:GNAT family N-acetyltransferase [Rhizobium sp. Root1203]KQV32105.1 acetyltransferase [Rhizobium sp. Root1203]